MRMTELNGKWDIVLEANCPNSGRAVSALKPERQAIQGQEVSELLALC